MPDDVNPRWTPEAIAMRAAELGPWFHNLDLRGVRTAPDHFLGATSAATAASTRSR